MPSSTRRTFLGSASAALAILSGCLTQASSSDPAHWVTVYLGEREKSHDVSVTIRSESKDILFEKEYRLSDSNEADENVPFSPSTDPETVIVSVDGTRFERDWPGFEQAELPCDDPNRAGIELWVENGTDGSPGIRMEAGCQHVTMD
ncbi:hypothetical protein Huta_1940 [Halorhabdus utahensis DSM 12940]|uniref:Lipoprotein n=1 Tax=Halorhabdus utahensis (strain DSM 12940 / JCM 11049 / AX-2) TaxID=519442 RepID=C7NT34_HALUD|nr:hypothetical protein [Halorhabdus utahensis]ACV12109.1 hypothetical protein Huta_1940 [Halorhabdus utahensis DSM 12940]